MNRPLELLLRVRDEVATMDTTYASGQPRSRLAASRVSRRVVLDLLDEAIAEAVGSQPVGAVDGRGDPAFGARR